MTFFCGKMLALYAQTFIIGSIEQVDFVDTKTIFCKIEMSVSKSAIEKDTIDYISLFMQVDSTKSYTQTRAEILKIKSKIDINTIGQDSLSKMFTELLVQKIIPYWYGTPWDFNGYTAVPNQGEIACGYFVSTTLLHCGLMINRYKMAQQLPVHEALTLNLGNPLIEIYNETVEENIEQLRDSLSEGIYFLGLDQSHVGFLLNRNDKLFVIHSNYNGGEGVTVERIGESQAFASYRRFYVAEISTNEKLMRKWVLGETVAVVEESLFKTKQTF